MCARWTWTPASVRLRDWDARYGAPAWRGRPPVMRLWGGDAQRRTLEALEEILRGSPSSYEEEYLPANFTYEDDI
jgi:hypothetical protein